MRTLNVGLVGLGNVGRAVARLFDRNARNYEKRLGARLRLSWVCDRHPDGKRRGLSLADRPKVTRRFEPVLDDPSVDVVIELIGGKREAKDLVLGALARGKRVITANKQLLAHEWERVFRAAADHRSSVAFEASVAGAVPILQALRTGLAANDISQVLGILNGTTNFILSSMAHEGWSFAQALREAQACGMAEADPTLDLDGTDAVHKVSVLASLVSGAWVRPELIYREGIQEVALEDMRFAAAELKRTVRLLGILRFDWSKRPVRLEARVHPALVPLEHPLAAVHGGYNAVMVQASAAQDLLFYGLGAGPEPAASAVLSDLYVVAQEILSGSGGQGPGTGDGGVLLKPMGGVESEFYLRLSAQDKPGVLAHATGELARQGISIARIHQEPPSKGSRVPIYITTHRIAWSRMERALEALRKVPGLDRRITCIRYL